MKWSLDWGSPKLQALGNRRKRKGKATKSLDDPPELFSDLLFVWDLFNRLNRARLTAFDASRLLVSDIVSLLDRFCSDDEEWVETFDLIQVMDEAFMEWKDQKNKRKKKE